MCIKVCYYSYKKEREKEIIHVGVGQSQAIRCCGLTAPIFRSSAAQCGGGRGKGTNDR